MNRFGLGLHRALFLGNGPEAPSVEQKKKDVLPPLSDEDLKAKIESKNRVVKQATDEEKKLKKRVVNEREKKVEDTMNSAMEKYDTEYYHVSGQVGSKVLELRKENPMYRPEQLKTFQDRAKDRQKSNFSTWNERIRQGYENLIKFLAERGYFYMPKAKSVSEVQERYMDEVSKYYENYILDTDDEKFNKIKDKLFTPDSGDEYPANIVCKKLTGAHSIFANGRSFREGYGVDVVRDVDRENVEVETGKDKANRRFLSVDLPNYLYDVVTGRVVVFGKDLYLGIKDRPSEVDRDAIEKFLIASSKIESKDKDPAVALLEVLRDSRIDTNTTKRDIKPILDSHGITIKNERYLNDIINVGNFYLSTQREGNSERGQHAIYLNILKIIEDEGGVAKAVEKFKPLVNQARNEKEQEVQQNYESGEVLQKGNQDLYDFVTKLKNKSFITDFAAATRLANLKKANPDYFKKVSIDRILANIDNDRKIHSNDKVSGGLVSGAQFRRIFNQIGEEKALPNLLKRAESLNKLLGLGLDTDKFTTEVAKKEIEGGNLELILLLQSIIANEGKDLHALLSGKESEGGASLFEGVDLKEMEEKGQLKEKAFKKAGEILKEEEFLKTYEDLFKGVENVDIESFGDLQGYLASCLYDNYEKDYKLAATAGTTISFDEWADGLYFSFGGGISGKKGVAGVSAGYSHTFALKHGWTLTGGLSAGVFIPIVSGDTDKFNSVGLNLTADKKTINLHTGTVHHKGVDVGFNIITETLYLGRHDRWDKSEGIREASRFQAEFQETIMLKMLDQIKAELNGKNMNLNDEAISTKVKNIIKEMVAKQPDIPEKDRDTVVNGMLMRLKGYDNANLNEPGVKYAIAEGIAAEYEQTWLENRKSEISAKGDGLFDGAYISGYSIGLFWKVGTPQGGVYASVDVKKHRIDGAGDRFGKRKELDSKVVREWSDENIREKNQELGLSGSDALTVKDGFVVIPASIKNRVNVNKKMEGLMKLDQNGDVLIDTHTPISLAGIYGSQTAGNEIVIGGKEGNHVKLDRVLPTWFTSNKMIDQKKLSNLGEKINTYDEYMLNEALDNLKKQFPGDIIQKFDFSEQSADLIDKLNKLDKTKVARIVIDLDENGKLVARDPETGKDGSGLELEYKADFEMMDKNAKDIADAVYAEALKTRNPRYLNAVKHDRDRRPHREEYDGFKDAIQNKDYNTARDKIKPIFQKLDENIHGAKFTEIGQKLDAIQDNNVLGQALMSINNVFARSVKVRGGGENYEFRTVNGEPISMGSIIAEREGQISNTIENYGEMDEEAKKAYIALIKASKQYRENNRDKFRVKSAPAAQLGNTVGFNLGDKNRPENPLFNPEIYDPMIDMKELENYGFDANSRKVLQERSMKLFATNEALMNPVLKRLGLDVTKLDIKDFKLEEEGGKEKGKLTLDIGGKKVTLSAGMKFGYFTQCVNHTVILNDISLEVEDGSQVSFGSDVWENGSVKMGHTSSLVSTRGLTLGLSFGVGQNAAEGEENSEAKTDHHDKGGKQIDTGMDGAEGEEGDGGTAGKGQGDSGGGWR